MTVRPRLNRADKSAQIGDLFVLDGRVHICSSYGFKDLGPVADLGLEA